MDGDELEYGTGVFDFESGHQGRWRTSRYRGSEGGIRKPEIEGMDRDGLLHISCLSTCRVEKVEDVLTVGDKVWVKVMTVEEDGKYKLDMRGINQKDGTDTDPNNVDRAGRPKSTPYQRADPIKLDAVLNVTCSRCKGTGHMRHECYNTTGEAYKMLNEEPADSGAPAKAAAPATTTAPPFATGANAVQLQKPLPTSQESEVPGVEKKRKSDPPKNFDGSRRKRHRRSSSSSSSGADTSSSSGSRKRKKRNKKKKKKTSESKKKKRRSKQRNS